MSRSDEGEGHLIRGGGSPAAADVDRHSDDEPGIRRKRALIVLVAILLLVLLLCCCLSYWPLPPSAEDGRSPAGRLDLGDGGVSLSLPSARLASEVTVGRKGQAVSIAFELTSTEDMAFESSFVLLQLGDTFIPALPSDSSAGRWPVPDTLRAGQPTRLEMLFAVPKGSHEATLVVQPGHLSPDRALRARVRLPASGRTGGADS